jgi:hypothetical protein
MTTAKRKEEWNHTATLMALIANVNRDPKGHKPFTPYDFHPLIKKDQTKPLDDISILKDVFVQKNKK